jgi:hypothetical protein
VNIMGEESKGAWGMIILSLAVNFFVLPLSFYLANFETNPSTDTASAFILRFLLVQSLPLTWLILSISSYSKTKKKNISM